MEKRPKKLFCILRKHIVFNVKNTINHYTYYDTNLIVRHIDIIMITNLEDSKGGFRMASHMLW